MASDPLVPALDRRFEAIVCDYDGTAVPDRRADATELRRVVEELSAAGIDLAIVSGTHVDNVDGQLRARPKGPGRLYLLLNRGSEVFRVTSQGVELLYRRAATPEEEAALTAAAELVVERLAAHHGLDAQIVSSRLNRRKIDIIPERAWADPTKAQMAELLAAVQQRLLRFGAGLSEVVEIALGAGRDAGLADPRVTTDAKHVEIGLTDKSDSARWILRELWARGIGPGLVLVAGDEMGPLGGLAGSDSNMLVPEAARATAVSVGVEPGGVPAGVIKLRGGPSTFLAILRDQIARRARHDPPEIDADPAWTVHVDGVDPMLERVREAQLTLGNGRLGTAGARVFANDVYEGDGTDARLLACPQWNHVATPDAMPLSLRRTLDLRTGLLREELETKSSRVVATLFASLARPSVVAVRARGPSSVIVGSPPLRAPNGGAQGAWGRSDDGAAWMTIATSTDGGVAAAAVEAQLETAVATTLDRVAAYAASPGAKPDAAVALDALRPAEQAGFDALLVEHRAAWARRWEDADVVIEGDDELQRDVRYSLFHLMGAVTDSGEAAAGARGLSGPAYRGHVFWDADVFALPFFAATHPESARAMLEYRLRRLPAAEARARAEGREGARFPWESAREGVEATPRAARDPTGQVIPILTGAHEEHIVADVAWAASTYLDWTGDDELARTGAARLLAATARYWASRIERDARGKAHIRGVIGPDEYHASVDDNAFTNVMARWNLRRAAGSDATDASADEKKRWLELADALVDGYDASTGLYEQFAGFFALEPLVISEIAKARPVAADVLLGRERVRKAQVVKQADVLMLHHMVPDEVAPGSLAANVAFYEPRTAHGSSLSPGIHAALLARAGRPDDALALLRLTTRIDLDDLAESTAGGLHLAAMGSVWQALAFGFAGLRPRGGALEIDPRLPRAWRALELRVRFRGSAVRVRIEGSTTHVDASPPVPVVVSEARVREGHP